MNGFKDVFEAGCSVLELRPGCCPCPVAASRAGQLYIGSQGDERLVFSPSENLSRLRTINAQFDDHGIFVLLAAVIVHLSRRPKGNSCTLSPLNYICPGTAGALGLLVACSSAERPECGSNFCLLRNRSGRHLPVLRGLHYKPLHVPSDSVIGDHLTNCGKSLAQCGA